MKTPRVTDLRVISPGKYGHYGLQQALEKIAPNALLHAAEYVSPQFNVDGMKPFKDTNMCMWPILGLREQKKMAALIAHIDSRCQSLQQSVDSLSAKIQTAGDSQSPSAGIPAYNMEQVINLNSNLQHPDFYKHVSDICNSIPGEDLRTLIRNILSRLISPAMSEEIHCGGKDKPFLFKNSRIYGFLLDQVNKRTAFSSVDSKTVSYEARLWFRLRREQMKGKPQEVSFLCLLQCISISSRVPNLPSLIIFRW
ncbi:unnamed protein product [Calicophoron daubneyi]|uniref:Uncharacterized protein n=1 Tax=Calicophoron daubneyi TaxID=300641 RepID=A0AAV2TG73_CALDB